MQAGERGVPYFLRGLVSSIFSDLLYDSVPRQVAFLIGHLFYIPAFALTANGWSIPLAAGLYGMALLGFYFVMAVHSKADKAKTHHSDPAAKNKGVAQPLSSIKGMGVAVPVFIYSMVSPVQFFISSLSSCPHVLRCLSRWATGLLTD